MNLTAEEYLDVLRRLQGSSAGSDQKRRAARIKYRAYVEVGLCEDGGEQRRLKLLLANISSRGVGLVSHICMKRGQQFVIRLPHKANRVAEILCTVVYCRPKAGGLFGIGSEFDCPVGQEGGAAPADQQIAHIREVILK